MNKHKLISSVLIVLLLLVSAESASGGKSTPEGTVLITGEDTSSQSTVFTPRLTSMTGEQIQRQVVSSGGSIASNASYTARGTVTQTAIGPTGSASYQASQGYWQAAASQSQCGAPGDSDNSGEVDIDDVVYLIAYIFSGGPPPTPVLCCGDADGSGEVDIDDVVYLIAYIFSAGPPPVPIQC